MPNKSELAYCWFSCPIVFSLFVYPILYWSLILIPINFPHNSLIFRLIAHKLMTKSSCNLIQLKSRSIYFWRLVHDFLCSYLPPNLSIARSKKHPLFAFSSLQYLSHCYAIYSFPIQFPFLPFERSTSFPFQCSI